MQMVLEVSAFALSSIMMGWIGAVELAAHQIVVTFGNFAFMAMVIVAIVRRFWSVTVSAAAIWTA